MQVKNIPESLILVTDSDEIEHIGESIGIDLSDYGCLFVGTETGEYSPVYGSSHSIPYLDDYVERLI